MGGEGAVKKVRAKRKDASAADGRGDDRGVKKASCEQGFLEEDRWSNLRVRLGPAMPRAAGLRVHQLVDGGHVVRSDEKEGERCALFRAAEGQRPTAAQNLERPEDSILEIAQREVPKAKLALRPLAV
jgi:hypothetical protein